MPATTSLRVVRLTPPGRSAIASLEVSGRQAGEIVDRFFRGANQRSVANSPPRRILLGYWRHGPAVAEEVVAVSFESDRVELHCHGGEAAVASIITSLRDAGAVEVPSEQWLPQKCRSPLAAEAWQALMRAPTERAASILLGQFHGALHRELAWIAERLTVADVAAAVPRLTQLMRRGKLGLHLTTPFLVVVTGPPNVGKSSLVNAIVGFERAIVYGQPGTTRDVVTVDTALDGWPVQFVDTAGLREAGDELETAGVDRARRKLADADLVLIVDQIDHPRRADADQLGIEQDYLLVANKVDLAGRTPPLRPGEHAVSARRGDGLRQLCTAIIDRLVDFSVSPSDAVPFSDAQLAAITAALECAQQGDSKAAAAWLGV